MSSVLRLLGVDPDELDWHRFAMCQDLDREIFFDKYESDETQARITDQVCLSCPVMKECLMAGTQNSEYGTWGGVYLERGKPDTARNAHKTKGVWDQIRGRIGDFI